MQVLHQKAPTKACAVRPPRLLSEREDAERATASWTAEIREFFSLPDGQKRPTGGETSSEVFPSFELLCPEEVVAQHRYLRDHLHDTEDFGDEWEASRGSSLPCRHRLHLRKSPTDTDPMRQVPTPKMRQT